MTRERRLLSQTLFLGALFAAAAAYLFGVEVPADRHQAAARAQAQRLFPFPASEAAGILLQHDGSQIALQQQGRDWRIVSPVRARADEITVANLLKALDSARADRTADPHPSQLAAYSLDRPDVVTLFSGQQKASIDVGAASPTGSFVFAQRGGRGPVLLVDSQLASVLSKTLYDLRDKTILDFLPDDVLRMSLRNGSHRVELAHASGPWQVVWPLHTLADPGAVHRVLETDADLRAESFVSEKPDNLNRYGLAHPWGSVEFDLTGGTQKIVLFGSQTKDGALTRYYARQPGNGPVFTINENLPQDAREPAQDWVAHPAGKSRAPKTG